MRLSRRTQAVLFAVVVGACSASQASAATVEPSLNATDMVHVNVTIIDSAVVAWFETPEAETPRLTELAPGDSFDPAMPWSVLEGTAHNFQYGWQASGIWPSLGGGKVWIEQLAATPELETYYVYEGGRVDNWPYDPIFGTAGSDARWQWSTIMAHNAYAVTEPTQSEYDATYSVYIGDAATGEPLPQFTPAEVTLRWLTDVPSADFDESGAVDGADFLTWQREFGAGNLGADDLQLWQQQFGTGASAAGASNIASVPEPAAGLLACLGVVAAGLWNARHRQRLPAMRWRSELGRVDQ
ncbi:MAG: hypothetical protein KDA44_01050 [Planctomycetales bacterium]|nr:hypothetical protein [Planctomycetales bacterium]